MRLMADRETLLAAVSASAKASATSGAAPLLGCLHIEVDAGHATITGSDLSLCVRSRLPVSEPRHGSCAVHGAALRAVLSNIDDAIVTLVFDGEHLSIGPVRLAAQPGHTFPPRPEVRNVVARVGIDGAAFACAVERVSRFADAKDSGGVCSGILIHQEADRLLRMVGMDGRRAAVFVLDPHDLSGPFPDVIVPAVDLARVPSVVKGSAVVTLQIGTRDKGYEVAMHCVSGDGIDHHVVIAQTLDRFPAYQRMLPHQGDVLGIFQTDRKALLRGIASLGPISTVARHSMVLAGSGLGIFLHTRAQEMCAGTYTAPVGQALLHGAPVAWAGVNAQHLTAALKGLGRCDDVRITIHRQRGGEDQAITLQDPLNDAATVYLFPIALAWTPDVSSWVPPENHGRAVDAPDAGLVAVEPSTAAQDVRDAVAPAVVGTQIALFGHMATITVHLDGSGDDGGVAAHSGGHVRASPDPAPDTRRGGVVADARVGAPTHQRVTW